MPMKSFIHRFQSQVLEIMTETVDTQKGQWILSGKQRISIMTEEQKFL